MSILEIPDFVLEYAGYQINAIHDNNMMRPEVKVLGVNTINTALRWLECGMMTIDEAMMAIATPFQEL